MIPRAAAIAWAGLLSGSLLFAANPYSVITSRNVFHLNPPPPPPAADKGPPPVLPKIFLSGFMWNGDKLSVLLVVKTPNPDLKSADLPSYLTLAEGAKDGAVELVKVYPEEGKVDILNSGTPMTLSMKDDGVTNDPALPPASRPPVRYRPPLLRRPPGVSHRKAAPP